MLPATRSPAPCRSRRSGERVKPAHPPQTDGSEPVLGAERATRRPARASPSGTSAGGRTAPERAFAMAPSAAPAWRDGASGRVSSTTVTSDHPAVGVRGPLGHVLAAHEGEAHQAPIALLNSRPAVRLMEVSMSITQDVAYSLRLMRKAPLFTAAVVLTIGLAIAATATIFSVVNAQILRPLPFKDPDRL